VEDKTVIRFATSPGSVRRGAHLNGTYEVGELIAHGGMGEVYRGFNIVTKDPVAIKMILPELSSNPDAFAMFLREASTLHNLSHEAIVRYFVFSVDPDLQRAYLAMEFVDGPSLTKRLAQGPLPIEDVQILQRRLAGALDAAHRVGVIHRDISSDNVILPNGDPRQAKIIDFGIAKSQRTGDGTIIGGGFAGKYNYVSPEQLGLAGGEVTAKSDIYSLGLVLAEALRGRPINMSGSQAEIIEKRRTVPDLANIDPRMRPLIAAMLQPAPVDRPENMATVAAWTPTEAGRTKAKSGRVEEKRSGFGRVAAVAAALIVILSIGGTVYAFRDLLPFGQTSLSGGDVSKSEHEAKIEPIKPADDKLPQLPQLPVENPQQQKDTGPIDVKSSDVKPSDGAAAEPKPSQPPPTPPKMDSSAPTLVDHPIQHVPTAEEILSTINPAKNKQPAAAPNAAPLPSENSSPAKQGANADDILNTLLASKNKPTEPHVSAKPAASEALNQKASDEPIAPSSHNLPPLPGQSPPGSDETSLSLRPGEEAGDNAPSKPTPLASNPPLGVEPPPPSKPTPLPSEPSPKTEPVISGPRAPQDLLALGEAVVGKNFTADLPPFSDPTDPKNLVLRVEPALPEGLVLSDLGSGLGAISGNPSKAGQYSFDIVARNASGATAKMSAKLAVLAPPSESASASEPAPPSPADKTAGFLRDFNGGPCFLTRSQGLAGGSPKILGVGADKATFERFYADFNRDVGVEPTFVVQLIARPQCPAVDLIGASLASDGPKIELTHSEVGRNKPLAGSVSNLAGRNLTLLLISTDGQVHRIDTRTRIAGASATFNLPLSSDSPTGDVMQIVVAIVSKKPLPSLVDFKAGAAAQILPRVQSDLAAAGGALETEFFKLVN
jgi:serine/threonine protein kinase